MYKEEDMFGLLRHFADLRDKRVFETLAECNHPMDNDNQGKLEGAGINVGSIGGASDNCIAKEG